LKGMTMLRDRRLAPHPTSTPITAQVIHGQSLKKPLRQNLNPGWTEG